MAVFFDLNANTSDDPYELPQAHLMRCAEPITCEARAHDMVQSGLLFVYSYAILYQSKYLVDKRVSCLLNLNCTLILTKQETNVARILT